jgi:hypothetical protein
MQNSHNDEWHRYYSEKRIVHQWMQVHLLKDLPVRRVLEIGPYLGAVTAMLSNAGYEPTVFEVDEKHAIKSPEVEKIIGDVRDFDSAAIANYEFDAIICCETLEHIPFEDVDGVVARFAASGIPYVLISVRYKGGQFAFNLYLNRFRIRKHTSFEKLNRFRRFRKPADMNDWEPHKWEVGYKDAPLARVRALLEGYFRIRRMEFTDGCKSVFFLCENKSIVADV